MTSRQVLESVLIELNKVQAPSLILEDYNYFINKTVLQYTNKIYNAYDMNQQKSDDIRVLKATAVLDATVSTDITGALLGKTYEVNLPDDYLHILNCLVEYNAEENFKCYNKNNKVHFGAKRLTADAYSQIINNYYMRPSYKNPYFYINNVNTSNVYPTSDNQVDVDYTPLGTEPRSENIGRISPNRYGNKSKVRMEIRYGKDDSLFKLQKVYIDYLKVPQFIRLTQDQIDEVGDNSQILEFPDYVCQELINDLVKLLMENASDPRLQTNIPVNQTIANPAQEQPKR